MKDLVAVGIGGFIGSILRYGTGLAVAAAGGHSRFPIATFAVNILGSLIAGAVLGVFSVKAYNSTVYYLLITGFCGGFTTFSMFSIETLKLIKEGAWGLAALYVLASFILCVGAVWAGMAIGNKLIIK